MSAESAVVTPLPSPPPPSSSSASVAADSALPPCQSTVPLELRVLVQWVGYRLKEVDGGTGKKRISKVPHKVDPRPMVGVPFQEASSTNSHDWSTFDNAVAAADAGKVEGPGFVFSDADPYFGIDLDGCRDVATGAIAPEALRIIANFQGAYWEVSPSGAGVHGIGRGVKPDHAKAKVRGTWAAISGKDPAIEVYDRGRYFTVTGWKLDGSASEIADCQAALTDLCETLWPRSEVKGPAIRAQSGGFSGTDQELLAAMFGAKNGANIRALWNGDASAHGDDHSAADASLMASLAFYTGRDAGRMERLFGESGLAARDKWTNRPDYRRRTIDYAIENCEQVYEPAEPKGKPRTKDELILLTEAQIRGMTRLAVDPIGRVHQYDQSVGSYEFDDNEAFASRLKKNFAANGKPFAFGASDVERLLMNLKADTPKFWREPPLTEINVPNGILNVETRELQPHSADFLWPNRFNIRYDPNAVCPETDRFLDTVLPADECVLFFEILGTLLIPELGYQTAFLLWGTGANGKSMFLELMKFILGERNYSTMPLDKLESNTFASSSLVGRLANIEEDMTVNKLPGSAIFKTIVGGGTVNVEQKYRDARDVRLYARLIISCNRFPRCADNSAGFFRRWLVLPFTKKNFDGEDSGERVRPRALLSKLEAEAPGILRKAVLALAEVRRRDGFTETQRMRDAKMEFKSLTDSLCAWLDENTIAGPAKKVQQKQLRNAYNRFCDQKGFAPLDEKEFSDKVVEYRPMIESRHIHDARYFVGIGMRADTAFAGDAPF